LPGSRYLERPAVHGPTETHLEPADALATIAELAVALTGFAGLLVALRAARRPWTPIEIAAIRILLVSSVSSFAFALLPLPMLLGSLAASATWSVSALALGTFMVLLVGLGLYAVHGQGLRPRRPLIYWSIEVSGALAAAIVLLGAADAFGLRGPASYAIGLLWLLFTAAVQFMLQIFESLRTTELSAAAVTAGKP
jgi:hypothetical protein